MGPDLYPDGPIICDLGFLIPIIKYAQTIYSGPAKSEMGLDQDYAEPGHL